MFIVAREKRHFKKRAQQNYTKNTNGLRRRHGHGQSGGTDDNSNNTINDY